METEELYEVLKNDLAEEMAAGRSSRINEILCGFEDKSMEEKSRTLTKLSPDLKKSLLYWAIQYTSTFEKYLLGLTDVDFTIPDREGNTAMHLAILNGKQQVVEYLCDYSQCFDQPNIEGQSPLHLAASSGQDEMVKLLLKHDKNVNRKNGEGATALHAAIRSEHSAVVQLLLAHRDIDPNVKDARKRTPLHFAAGYHFADGIKYLLANSRVDPGLKDGKGRTARYYAKKSGCDYCFAAVQIKKRSFFERLVSFFQPAQVQLSPPITASNEQTLGASLSGDLESRLGSPLISRVQSSPTITQARKNGRQRSHTV